MKGRVVFSRHEKADGCAAAAGPPRFAAQSTHELLVQLQDFPGMDHHMKAEVVQDVVCKFLDQISEKPKDGSEVNGSRWKPFVQVIHDVKQFLPYGWLKMIAPPDACKSLTAKLQMSVVLHHGTGTIRFHSPHFPLSGRDLAAQFQGLQLMDRTPDFPSGGQASYSGPSCAPGFGSAAGPSGVGGSSSSTGPSSAAAATASPTWFHSMA